jgi:hypothetical protein
MPRKKVPATKMTTPKSGRQKTTINYADNALYVIFISVAFAILWQISILSPKQLTSSPLTSNNKSKIEKEFPTYDEYIKLSKRELWKPPHDPLEKLTSIVMQYTKISDMNTNQNSVEIHSNEENMIKYLNQEIYFLLQVLKLSTHKPIDLTDLIHSAIESCHVTLYSAMKARLRYMQLSTNESSSSRSTQSTSNTHSNYMLTKTQAEKSISQWIYLPLQAVLKLVVIAPKDNKYVLY